MRKLDALALVPLLFVSLATGAVGCGSGTKARPGLDAGVDRPPDVANTDTTRADAPVPTDQAKADASLVADSAKADALLLEDGATPDVPQLLDASPAEASLDMGGADALFPQDVASQEAIPVLDASAGEAGTGVDGAVAVDAVALSMATITFRLDNTGTETAYLRNECWIGIEVTSASDATVYSNAQLCACDCADATCTGDLKCAPCAPPAGVALEAGKTRDIAWIARKSTIASKTGPSGVFQCVSHAPIAIGAYRVAVVVYSSESDAAANTNGKTITRDFALGTANATVTVPIP